jgi:ribosomal protein S18 acetylase RimI-like enzyme
MPELKGDILRLPRDRIETAAAMLTRAFFDDPKLVHFLPEVTAKKELSRFLFEFELRYGINYGEVYTTSPATEGVAVWLPSAKSEITFWRGLRSGGMQLQQRLGKTIMDRVLSFSTTVDDLHRKHAPFPHYYLFFIGVDPAYQRKRVASRLITPMLGWLDNQNLPCYLNTQNEKNIGLYEHYSFRVIEQVILPGSGIVHTAMLRKPDRAPGSK